MIDTGAIRDKVLDLALCGNLSEQRVSDGTADDLYEKVQKEKDVLVKEGKISKNKVIHIKEEERPFEIPDNWKWIRWGDLSESIQYGYNAPAKPEGRIKMVRISDIQDNKVLWDTVPYCDIEEESIEAYLLHENDILFARTGGTVGKSYIVSDIPEEAVFAGYLIRTSYSSNLNSKYMKYFMESKLYWKQLQSGTIATAQPNCNGKTLSKMMVPLPPFAEQIRIVEKIDSIFSVLDIIDDLQEQYANDREVLKSKLIDAGIRGKLTEQLPEDGTAEELRANAVKYKESIVQRGLLKNRKNKDIKRINEEDVPHEIPESWRWFRLGEIAEVFGRIGFRGYKKTDLVQKGQGAITMSPSNISKTGEVNFDESTYISWEKYEESPEIMLEEGDVVLVKTGSTYGKSGIIESLPEKATINPQLAILKYIQCNRRYLAYALRSSAAWEQYESFVVGAATPTFSQEKLSNMLLPMPPMPEQNRIVEKLDLLIASM